MSRILLLADAASEHTQKWAIGLAQNGIEVGVFSFNKSIDNWHQEIPAIKILFQPNKKNAADSLLTKLLYLKYVCKLKKIIAQFKPDIVHAHYATSYGLIGRLSGFHPFIISVWGTDVMRFPQQNFINKKILKNNFKKADVICATSHTIKNYIHQIIDKPVEIIPFGVDCTVFTPHKFSRKYPEDTFVIGCVKSLEDVYRIDVLIHAFKIVFDNSQNKNMKLLIVGGGSKRTQLKDLCSKLQIEQQVEFTGKIPHMEVVNYFNSIDVLCNLSDYESFGVSVIEAMACEVPVIATNTGGLKEIIETENLGLLVKTNNINETVNAIQLLMDNKDIRKKISYNAKQHVLNKYNWQNNINSMIAIYRRIAMKNDLIPSAHIV